MKRDMDLVREILLEAESWKGSTDFRQVMISARDQKEVDGHVFILSDAGLMVLRQGGDLIPYVSRLKWEGHEFLDAARNPKVWEKAKETFSEKGMGMPFEVLKALLSRLVSDAVFGGLP